MALKPMWVSHWRPRGQRATVYGAWLQREDGGATPEFGQTELHEGFRALFWLQEPDQYGHGVHLRVRFTDGYEETRRIVMTESQDQDYVAAAPLLPVRVEQGRYRTDERWIRPYGYTCLSLPHYVKTNGAEAIRLLDRAEAARRNYVRAAANLAWGRFGGAFTGMTYSVDDPSQWDILDATVRMAATRSLYTRIPFFCDLQYFPNADRWRWVREFAAFCRARPTVWAQLSNEPWKNGFTSVTDPELLALAREFKRLAPNTLLSIGDPPDVDGYSDLQQVLLEAGADELMIHGSRLMTGDRFRWVNHLKNFEESRKEYLPKRPGLVHDEKMGGASIFDSGRRDNSVVAHVAAAFVALAVGGDNYMHRVEENDGVPGLFESAPLADMPGGPEYRFLNDKEGDAPSQGFTGYTKIRWLSNGQDAWGVAYGVPMEDERRSVRWGAGWRVTNTVIDLADDAGVVRVWQVAR